MALCHRVPHKNITVKAMHWSAVLGLCLYDPVVVVRGPEFVRVAVLKGPSNAIDEDCGVFFHDLRLALLAR